MKKLLSVLSLSICVLTGRGFEMPAATDILPDGTLKFGDARLTIAIADTAWRFINNKDWSDNREEHTPDSRYFSGRIHVADSVGTVGEELRYAGPNRLKFRGSVEFASPVACNTVSAALTVPFPVAGVRIDGKTLAIPEVPGNQAVFAEAPATRVEVELPGGITVEFSGHFTVYVQDSRRWGNSLAIRFLFKPGSGAIRKAELNLDLAVKTPKTLPVDLRNAANRTLYDRDGRGWTGQGKNNDLAGLKPGEYPLSGIMFRIAEEKNTVVIGRTAPSDISLPLPPGFDSGAINLLHASAFTPEPGRVIGYLGVLYSNGEKEQIPVRSGIDCDNWHLTISRSNAAIAVQRENPTAAVGLYASSFPFSGRKPVSVTFRIADPNVFWMISAVTLSDRKIHFAAASGQHTVTMAPGEKWRPYRFRRRILPGSPLDFSGRLEAPAGKFGFVKTTSTGEFVFADRPEKPVRFFGVNLCNDANFPDRATAEEMADYLAKLGCNAIRIHHHDNGLSDQKSNRADALDATALDRLDYLFAQLKKRGIYITTDLYTSRAFQQGDPLLKPEYRQKALMKALVPIDRDAMENWKAFARAWMEHVNPYTGIAWGKDPALICLNLINEEPLVNYWAATPQIAGRYRAKFEQWKQKRHSSDEDFLRFLHELQAETLDEQLDFVKKELRLETPVTSLNCNFNASLTLLRDKFDLVDNHQYFAHPAFPEKPWSLPHRYDQSSPIRRNAVLPRLMMPTRIFGKPFIVTEFNYCNPNIFRAAGGPLFGTYAAMQNWAGVWRFAWSHTGDTLNQLRDGAAFDAVNDPMQQYSDRIIHALFLRGDFVPADRKISIAVPPDPATEATAEFPDAFSSLGLNAQIGSHVAGKTPPPGVEDYQTGMTVRPDPRVKLDPVRGTFAVVTPFTEAVVLPEGDLAANLLRIRGADTFMTVAAISLDGTALAESRSILLIHLTNFSTAGTRFGDAGKTLLQQWGSWPHLIERGTATVELAAAGAWRVVALASDGSAAGDIKATCETGKLRFAIDTFAYPEGVSAYHLTR